MQQADLGNKEISYTAKLLDIYKRIFVTGRPGAVSSFAKLLLKRMKKFGSETSFRDVFSDFSLLSSDWKSLKEEEVYGRGWVDMSYQDEKYRLAILQFLILNLEEWGKFF